MSKKNIKLLNKKFNRPITCLTAYSSPVAKIIDGLVDLVLVGDSLGTTLYGMKNTQSVTLEMMINHGAAVCNFINKSITMVDMPYKTYDNKSEAFKNSAKLLGRVNTNMLKIEINKSKLDVLEHLSNKKINVVAHLGVTPQSFRDFKKIKVLGKKDKEIEELLVLAKEAESAGAKALLLECVTKKTAKIITDKVAIPTIGIGASNSCDGQIIVMDDLVNLEPDKKSPRFVKKYTNIEKVIKSSVKKYVNEVRKRKFPSIKNTYY